MQSGVDAEPVRHKCTSYVVLDAIIKCSNPKFATLNTGPKRRKPTCSILCGSSEDEGSLYSRSWIRPPLSRPSDRHDWNIKSVNVVKLFKHITEATRINTCMYYIGTAVFIFYF